MAKRMTATNSIRDEKRLCGIANCTFRSVPAELKEQIGREIQADFDLWWETWIEPQLARIDAKRKRRKRA